ncbi:MAG: hypothetical protein M1343_08295 [Chloroflexi bacterium]|nr:hypothetical protein [Chloroflexota bacterium]
MPARISQNRHDGPGAQAFERFMEAMIKGEGDDDPDELTLKRMAQKIEDIKQVFRERALGQQDAQADAVYSVSEHISCESCSLWNDEKRRCKVEANLAGDALMARVLAKGCNVYSKRSSAMTLRPVGAIRQASVAGDIKREAQKQPEKQPEKPNVEGGFAVLNASHRNAPIRRRE